MLIVYLRNLPKVMVVTDIVSPAYDLTWHDLPFNLRQFIGHAVKRAKSQRG